MGQRHQAFLIARVVGYRCIAALHNQWCYGTLPLRAIRRFFDLVKIPQNAEIVSHEIKTLRDKYGAEMAEELKFPEMPCPYAYLLLSSAFSMDLQVDHQDAEPYISAILPLEATMGCFDGDNNDGITIIDVTDPLHPMYTLVTYGSGDQGYMPTLESARSYLRHYIPEFFMDGPGEAQVKRRAYYSLAEKLLDGERRISVEMLIQAWPKEYSGKVLQEGGEDEFVDSSPILAPSMPSLVDLTIEPALHKALADGSVESLEHFTTVPSTAKVIKDVLKKKHPFPSTAVPLMSYIFEQEARSPDSVVDVSDFPTCTTEQILDMLSNITSIDTLNLSNNSQLTMDTVHMILQRLPNIRRLVLLNTGVNEEDLRFLLTAYPHLFYHVESLVHPLCLLDPSAPKESGWSPRSTPRYPYQFTYLVCASNMYTGGDPVAFSLATFTLPKVIQAITDLFRASLHEASETELMSGEPGVKSTFGAETRRNGDGWGKRVVGVIPDTSTHSIEHSSHGEGWIFAVYHPGFGFQGEDSGLPAKPCFGFFRRVPLSNNDEKEGHENENLDARHKFRYEPHTLRSFLSTCENDGRTPAAPEDVSSLENIFARLTSEGDRCVELTPEVFAKLLERTVVVSWRGRRFG